MASEGPQKNLDDHHRCAQQLWLLPPTTPAHDPAHRYHLAVISRYRRCLVALLLTAVPALAAAATSTAYLPSADTQVLARVPARGSDPRARELLALRQVARNQPQDVQTAVQLASRYFDEVAAEGDPRYVGYAQAALQAWWHLAEPPVQVRVLRAQVLQFDHRFTEALADLDGALRQQPDLGRAWAWRTAILMVQANYAEARRSCEQMAPLGSALIAAGCTAQVDAATGHAAAAASALRSALAQHANAAVDERLWCLTRLAETEERLGRSAAAEAAFQQALALGSPDVYLQAAYADFLLDRGRAADVLRLLKDRGRADVLLLRQALAAKAARDPSAAALAQELTARFAAAKQRGDTSHQKEESRFALALQGDAARALVLAQQNFAQQREPADARILLEAALAARNVQAARPALDWLTASGIDSVALQALATQLKALR